MSAYQQFINESIASQHIMALMREASDERALRAMQAEEGSEQSNGEELTQPIGAVPRPSRLRHAWNTLASFMASFL